MRGGRSRSNSPHAPHGWRNEGLRVMGLAAEGRFHHERREARGSVRRRDGGGGRQDGHGDRSYCLVRYGRDGGSLRRQDTPARRGGTTASGTSGGEYTGESARRSRIRGRGAHGGPSSPRSRESSRERSRSASDRDRQYVLRNLSGAKDDGMRGMGTATCPGSPLPLPSGGLPRGPWNATTAAGCMGAGPHTRGPLPMVALRPPRARSGAGPLTFTSARSSRMPHAMVAAPRRPCAARWSRPMAIGGRYVRRIERVRPPTGMGGCSAATTPGSTSHLPVPRASCGMGSGAPGPSAAGMSPAALIPSAVMCVASTSRTWTSAEGVRAGWSVGSPRPAPSCGGRALTAFAPATRTGRTTSSSAGTLWTGLGATACLARRAGACATRRRRAGCT